LYIFILFQKRYIFCQTYKADHLLVVPKEGINERDSEGNFLECLVKV